jgi:hypothetical protein
MRKNATTASEYTGNCGWAHHAHDMMLYAFKALMWDERNAVKFEIVDGLS